jgi:DNA-binding NarL/FixJ family response regulator
MPSTRIRVFLVDDHEVVRRGIAALLDAEPDIDVVGEASTARQALGRIAATRPDVAVLDVRLPDGSGIDVCRSIRQSMPTVRCLILTAFDDDEALRAAIIADASGYVTKDIRAGGLIGAVRATAGGRRLLNPSLAGKAITQLKRSQADPAFESLGLREHQIVALIADGLTNREIAARIGLAEKTVKNYVSSLLSKLGLEHRTQAAIMQLKHAQAEDDARLRRHDAGGLRSGV